MCLALLVTAACGVDRVGSATVDPNVPRSILIGEQTRSVAVADGVVWVTSWGDGRLKHESGSVTRVELLEDEAVAVATIGVGAFPIKVAVGAEYVWVVNRDSATVSRISPGSNQVSDTISVGGRPVDIAIASGAVWVTDSDSGSLIRIDMSDNSVKRYSVGASAVGVVHGFEALWITDDSESRVHRFDIEKRRVTASVRVDRFPGAITAGEVAIWVVHRPEAKVSRIDPDVVRSTTRIPGSRTLVRAPPARAGTGACSRGQASGRSSRWSPWERDSITPP